MKNFNSDDFELQSLNIDELDIEELEQRLELAGASVTPYGYTCKSHCTLCGVDK